MQMGAERGGEGGDGCQGTTPRSGGKGDDSGTGNSRVKGVRSMVGSVAHPTLSKDESTTGVEGR